MKTLLIFLLAQCVLAQTVSTDHYTVSRQGSNTSEITLTPANVARLVKVRSYSVDDAVWTQPLYIPNITVSGTARNLLIVASMNNTVYAFDADGTTGTSPLWSTTLETPWTNLGAAFLYNSSGHPNTGCLSTPVADPANDLLYAVCAGGGTTPHHKLWKLNLQTGAVVTSTTVSPSVTGTGDTLGGPDNVSGGVLTLYPAFTLCRPGLLLGASNVYVSCGSTGDFHPWHGWLVSYNTSDLSQAAVFCTTNNSWGAALWGGGKGPIMDSTGNIYIATGNGDYNGANLWGMTILKLSASLAVLDWYTPSNWSTLNASDFDIAPGGIMLLNDRYVAWESKQFLVYALDGTCMGHLGGTVGGCSAPQVFATPFSPPMNTNAGSYSQIFLNGVGYFSNTVIDQSDVSSTAIGGYSFAWSGSSWTTTPAASSPNSFQYSGPTLAGSSNAGSNSILWAITVDLGGWSTGRTGTLRAWNASTWTEYKYWTLGTVPKFASPTIAAGKVFVATLDGTVSAFGLSPTSIITGKAVVAGGAVIR